MVLIRKLSVSVLCGCGLLLQACDSGPTGPRTGSLTVNIADLPAEIAAAVTVQGAVGTSPVAVSATRTIPDLEPGVYTVTAAKAIGTRASYTPALASQTVEVAASRTPAVVSVGHTLATGLANVTISGLPAGAVASATVFNNAGFFVNLKSSGEVGNLQPGTYTLQLDPVSADEVYAGAQIQTTFEVTASTSPVQVQGTYAATTGTIQLSATGLPQGAVPVWDVSGPNGGMFLVRGDQSLTLSKLPPATYTVTARTFDFGTDTWGAASPSQVISVTAGIKSAAAFAYVTRPPTLNLSVEGAYITQSTQRFNGSVPLITGRPAFLRVFVKASEANLARPKVRARFYRNGELQTTSTMEYAGQSVATAVNERSFSESWGVAVPPGLIGSGLSILVDVDPDNTVREVDESDNAYPSSGTPLAFDVREVPVAEIRFVPIETTANGMIGNVTEGRVTDFMMPTLSMFPIGASSVEVRASFATAAPAPVSNDANGAWMQIINELNAKRLAEGSSHHYVGVLKVAYSAGIAGVGFLPGKTALVWDASSANYTLAHELGHNWGRNHAPCGGAPGVDPNYPYPGARIGVYGFDVLARLVQDTERRDVMSYCSPEWVSDYTYEGILNFRGSTTASSVSNAVQSSLIVWGRVHGSSLILEPAFLSDTRPSLPVKSGSHRVEGIDASGATVFSLSFEPERISTDDPGARQFGFAVPMTAQTASRIVSLRLSGDGSVARVNAVSASAAPGVVASAVSSDEVRLTWDDNAFPLLVVRDPDTREILAFARGGDIQLRTRKRSFDIAASNRAASTRLTIQTRN